MSSLNAQLDSYKSDLSKTAARNLQHARPAPATPARSTTPKPIFDPSKRPAETSFTKPNTVAGNAASANAKNGPESLLTTVFNAIDFLKRNARQNVPARRVIDYLSIPKDDTKTIPRLRAALRTHERVTVLPKEHNGEDCYRYRPIHPVENADELRDYLARQPTFKIVVYKDLKDTWPEAGSAIETLERQGHALALRSGAKGELRGVWADSPQFHLINPHTHEPTMADQDFIDAWGKVKLPAAEGDLRTELEKAGLTPTSLVKEKLNVGGKRKEKRKINRKGGKTTNNHLAGVLKDYKR